VRRSCESCAVLRYDRRGMTQSPARKLRQQPILRPDQTYEQAAVLADALQEAGLGTGKIEVHAFGAGESWFQAFTEDAAVSVDVSSIGGFITIKPWNGSLRDAALATVVREIIGKTGLGDWLK
jgi:hypothetical protein